MFRRIVFIVFAIAAIGCTKNNNTGTTGSPDIIDAVSGEDVQADTLPADRIMSDNGIEDADGTEGLVDVQVDTGPVELKVDHLNPDRGLAEGGQKIHVIGRGFTPKMQVIFGNQPSTQVQWVMQDTLEAITPPHPPGDVDVKIIRPDGATQTIKQAFTFYNPVTITSVAPSSIPVEGSVPIVIRGRGFKGLIGVWFGNTRVNLAKEVSDSMINCVAPAHAAGTLDVKVAAGAGQGTALKAVTYYERPLISFLDPPAGPVAGGNAVIIRGTGLDTTTSVTLGGQTAKVLSVTDDAVTISAPAGVAGPADVQVITGHGTAMLTGGYIYMTGQGQQPAILNVFPGRGPVEGGNNVMLALNFTPQDPHVSFGQSDAPIIAKGQYFVQVTAPSGTAGPVDVAINDNGAQAVLTSAYTYEKLLSISGIMPGSGRSAGGEDIRISGSGFDTTCTVSFGDIAAKAVNVTDSSRIIATTPAHQPGIVDVSVECPDAGVTLAAGFVFTDMPHAEILYPDQGSIGGGTLVRVSGVGFFGNPKVSFGGNPASHVEVVSPDLITLRTPMGLAGPVDVSFKFDDNSLQVLKDGFVYYDPASSYGGTWGGENTGTLNVTAIEGGTGKPVTDAYVIIGSDPTTPYQGYTDQQGMIAFAGPDLQPPMTVSINKDCFASESMVVFNSTNVTFIMTNTCSSGSGTPPSITPATLNGTVSGLGKYIIPPPGNCYATGVADDGINCMSCWEDDECGADNKCIKIGDYGTFCATPCKRTADCPEGWACMQMGMNDLRCIPKSGIKQARCGLTQPNIFRWNPKNLINVDVEGGSFTIQSNPGTVSLVCVGGVYDAFSDIFTPMAMGLKRHIVVHEGDTINNLDIRLDILLNHRIKIRLDHPPLKSGGPDFIATLIYYDFGSEGVFGSMEQPMSFSDNIMVGYHQPASLTGELNGVTYSILGGAFSYTQDNTPMSLTHAWGIDDLEDDVFYLYDGENWYADRQGLRKDIYGAFGFGINDVFVVGEHGSAYLYDGQGFQPQLLPVSTDMFGIWGNSADDIYAVGDKGVVVHFDGQSWQQVDISGINNRSLHAVGGSGPDNIFVGGDYIMAFFDGTNWRIFNTSMDMRSILCTADGCFGAGTFGHFARLSPTGMTRINTGIYTDLFGIAQGPDDCIWLCGENGYLARYCNGQLSAMDSGTDQTLRAAIRINDTLVFMGDNGAIVRVKDNKIQSLFVDHYKPDIYAAYADPATGKAAAFGMSHLLLGPMLDPAEPVYPAPDGMMTDLKLSVDFKNTPPAAFQYMQIVIPGLFSDTPVWNMYAAGDVKHVNLPDFSAIEGNPDIPKGVTYNITVMRIYSPNFSVDNFDFTDLDTNALKAWTFTTWSFSR